MNTTELSDPGATVRQKGETVEEAVRFGYFRYYRKEITESALMADAEQYRKDRFQFPYPYLLEYLGILRFCLGVNLR